MKIDFKEMFEKTKNKITDLTKRENVEKKGWVKCPVCKGENRVDFDTCVMCGTPLKNDDTSEK